MSTVLHYAEASWSHTKCGKKVTSGITVVSNWKSVTCARCA